MPITDRYPFRSDIRASLVEAASKGDIVNYLDLGAGRAMIGRYLIRIAMEEREAGRPPLTSVVVRKDTGLPGAGFLEAMVAVGYIASAEGEDERDVWDRAVRQVFEYWRPKLRDDLK